MKKLLIIVLLCLSFSSCKERENTDIKQTSIETGDFVLNPKHFDLGTIKMDKNDTIRKFKFDIQNNSSDSIHISKVDVSCGCLKIQSAPNLIHPLSHGEIHGYINLSNLKGHLSKAIFVNYNDGKVIVLRIKGDIIK